MITTWTSCRACGGKDLESILNLGNFYLSTFLADGDPEPPRCPLDLVICGACNLVQMRHSVDPDRLFRKYWYLSGINEAMRAELADVVEQAGKIVGGLHTGDQVIDIGANDGTLLSKVPRGNRIAFEPALNLQEALRQHAEVVVSTYFRGDLDGFQAKAIFSIACFYDLDDPRAFVEGIAKNLHPQGIWVVQFQDLLQMLQATAVDNLCHEHVTCPSLTNLVALSEACGLAVGKAERRAINGGSLRLYIRHKGIQDPDPSVAQLLSLEKDLYHELQQFSWRVSEVKRLVITALDEANQFGPVDAYGASTKFSTLAQYCGLGPTLLRQCVERSPEKWGLKTVTGIPIVSEEAWREDPPPSTLLAIWQFRNQVLLREAKYLAQGGAFIVPLPKPELVYAELKAAEGVL